MSASALKRKITMLLGKNHIALNKDAPEANEAAGDGISVYSYISKKDRNKFERILEKRLAIYPDAMTVKRVVDIIGYSDKTIRWFVKEMYK